MSSMMDLDSSLEDIIKHKGKRVKGQNSKSKPQPAKAFMGKRTPGTKATLPIISKKNINKQTKRPPVKGLPGKPLFTGKSFEPRLSSKIDPSAIVITKSVVGRPQGTPASRHPGRFQGRLGKQPSTVGRPPRDIDMAMGGQRQNVPSLQTQPLLPVERQPFYQPRSEEKSFSIRGLAHGGNGTPGISIRGESGPFIVLISNLDPEANTEDVKTACSQFGPVVRCEVLTDRAGRSYGEAEVEFTAKSSALDCIAQMDNEVADGRVLRVILRNKQSSSASMSSGFNAQTVRSTIAPTRSGYTTATASGKMYSDQMIPTGPASSAPQNYSRLPSRRY
ncbi:hypothetical protein BDF14DRAFT_1790031 [Spinellus fusiger]|nr:hypothetical protein BDF14DRAFT_1790031 [Spinellus fusiger]